MQATNYNPSATTEIQSSDSSAPIYAWYDSSSQTIYYYTDAEVIYLNSDSSYMFNEFYYMTTVDTTNWDTSNVTNMFSMFSYCTELTDIS